MRCFVFVHVCVFFCVCVSVCVCMGGWVGRCLCVCVWACVRCDCDCVCVGVREREREGVRLRVRVCMSVWKLTTDLFFSSQSVQATGQTESDRLKLTEKLAPKLEEALGNPISSLQVRVSVVSL